MRTKSMKMCTTTMMWNNPHLGLGRKRITMRSIDLDFRFPMLLLYLYPTVYILLFLNVELTNRQTARWPIRCYAVEIIHPSIKENRVVHYESHTALLPRIRDPLMGQLARHWDVQYASFLSSWIKLINWSHMSPSVKSLVGCSISTMVRSSVVTQCKTVYSYAMCSAFDEDSRQWISDVIGQKCDQCLWPCL